MKETVSVSLDVNGRRHEREVEPRLLLVHLLRERLGLTGTNVGCDTTSCGACTVLLDGESVKSCTVLAAQASGHAVTTIEGLPRTRQLHPMQQAFREYHGAAVRLLHARHGDGGRLAGPRARSLDDEVVRYGLKGNLCRCTGYQSIVERGPARRGCHPCGADPRFGVG